MPPSYPSAADGSSTVPSRPSARPAASAAAPSSAATAIVRPFPAILQDMSERPLPPAPRADPRVRRSVRLPPREGVTASAARVVDPGDRGDGVLEGGGAASFDAGEAREHVRDAERRGPLRDEGDGTL